jgi:hypothetical protein
MHVREPVRTKDMLAWIEHVTTQGAGVILPQDLFGRRFREVSGL